MSKSPAMDILVLDAAPLLSLSPLRGLAKIYVTTPQVLAELRDPRAREHFQKLGTEGVDVLVRTPDVLSYSKVTTAAKKSGDFAVLSQTDMMLLALTVSMEEEHRKQQETSTSASAPESVEPSVPESTQSQESEVPLTDAPEEEVIEIIPDVVEDGTESNPEEDSVDETGTVEPASSISHILEQNSTLLEPGPLHQDSVPIPTPPDLSHLSLTEQSPAVSEPPLDNTSTSPKRVSSPLLESEPSKNDGGASSNSTPVFHDPVSEDDGEGEWITPDNVSKFKSREIFPGVSNNKKKGKGNVPEEEEKIGVGCMTADYAMQNVLLHMGLNLVGLEGKNITSVKTWVLRCHACYKLCKDQTKKFCPSCGNATLLRASVSTTAPPPGSPAGTPATVQVHLKSNYQYRLRGTKYSIPAPKPGSAKHSQNNIILREDQIEFQRGVKSEAVRARKEEKKIASALAASSVGDTGSKTWMDPDWMPDMMLGKSSRQGSALPDVGYGRRNPNEVRKKKR